MQIPPVQFGMSTQRVQEAVQRNELVKVTKGDGKVEVCELHGPFTKQELPPGLAKEVAVGKPGIDPSKDVQTYLIGFRHVDSPDPKFREVVSHGIVFEQEGEIPAIDLLG